MPISIFDSFVSGIYYYFNRVFRVVRISNGILGIFRRYLVEIISSPFERTRGWNISFELGAISPSNPVLFCASAALRSQPTISQPGVWGPWSGGRFQRLILGMDPGWIKNLWDEHPEISASTMSYMSTWFWDVLGVSSMVRTGGLRLGVDTILLNWFEEFYIKPCCQEVSKGYPWELGSVQSGPHQEGGMYT